MEQANEGAQLSGSQLARDHQHSLIDPNNNDRQPMPLHGDTIAGDDENTGGGAPFSPSSTNFGSSSTDPTIPPYWRHYRNISHASQTSLDAGQNLITLEDHSEDPACDVSKGLWAKNVTIDDHTVVKGESGIGAYVVWICHIQTLEGASMVVRMRYSEFVNLRAKLVAAFPHSKKSMPELPPKSVLFKFRPKFLEARRVGLAYFLNCVLLNPEFSGSPILKETLFSHTS